MLLRAEGSLKQASGAALGDMVCAGVGGGWGSGGVLCRGSGEEDVETCARGR